MTQGRDLVRQKRGVSIEGQKVPKTYFTHFTMKLPGFNLVITTSSEVLRIYSALSSSWNLS